MNSGGRKHAARTLLMKSLSTCRGGSCQDKPGVPDYFTSLNCAKVTGEMLVKENTLQELCLSSVKETRCKNFVHLLIFTRFTVSSQQWPLLK